MNDRIKDLFEQACFETEYDDVQNLREMSQRFAELIVRDICDMVNKHIQWNNPNDCPVVLDIKERYGVEE